MITVNGESKTILENSSISDYLAAQQYKANRIAVELNGEIVPKSCYSTQLLHSGDVLEIVSFVGGG